MKVVIKASNEVVAAADSLYPRLISSAEVSRFFGNNPEGVLAECDDLDQILQGQFDDEIYQRDGVLEKYSAAEAKIAELMQELAKRKEVNKSLDINMMARVISLHVISQMGL